MSVARSDAMRSCRLVAGQGRTCDPHMAIEDLNEQPENDDDRRDNRPVAVISRAMARRYWPDGDALGRILRRPDPALPDVEIVGVAGDIMVRSLGEPPARSLPQKTGAEEQQRREHKAPHPLEL